MSVDHDNLKDRTKAFALSVMNIIDGLPKTEKGRVLANQLMRSSTSVGANFRSACRGRSKKEFIAKIGVALEEADESAYWLELVAEGNVLDKATLRPLWKEADELCAILFSVRRNASEPDS